MKVIRRLFVAAFALISTTSIADLVQPGVPGNPEEPLRVSGGIITSASGVNGGFGLRNLGAGLGIAHNAGYDFTYGISVAGSWASHNSTIFTDRGKGTEGGRLDVELMTRYMPELAEKFYAGLVISLGWSRQFGENAKAINDNVSFGDLNFKVGPSISYGFTDSFALSFAAKYSMHDIRFGVKEGSPLKAYSNRSGLDLPLVVWLAVSDTSALFLEANTRFKDFKTFGKSFQEEVTLGFSVNI